MKLVPDAVRDIMLYLEENLTLEVVDNKPEYSSISYLKLADELVPSKHYSKEEVVYAIQQLCQCDMIKAHITTGKSRRYITCDIYDISWTVMSSSITFVHKLYGKPLKKKQRNLVECQ